MCIIKLYGIISFVVKKINIAPAVKAEETNVHTKHFHPLLVHPILNLIRNFEFLFLNKESLKNIPEVGDYEVVAGVTQFKTDSQKVHQNLID